MKHIVAVLGTRPEAIKLAPVICALRGRPAAARVTVCATGQHREMLDQTLAAFDLSPEIDLGLMQPKQHPTELLGRLLLKLRGVIAELRPDVLLVQGDTTSVMAAALAGYLDHVRVAHVEAGLRTCDKQAPFPEEVHRRVAGVVADDHFAPTPEARDNLLREGVAGERIFVTGNTVVDALESMRRRVAGRPLPPQLDPAGRRLVLITAHRRESFGEPLRRLCAALVELARRFDDALLLYPVHLNPQVREPVRALLSGVENIRLVEPVDYATFVALLLRADLILTDSGGIQEEAPALGKPVLVLREKTERPEAVAAGVVRLVGTDPDRIVAEASRLLSDPAAYRRMARRVCVYGDGRAAERICQVLLDGRMHCEPFVPQAEPQPVGNP